MSGAIDEYMVKLGASVDASGMQRFYQALREASTVADVSAKSIAGAFFKAQTEIVGGFLAIGTAALGMVDKVAMADQQYRLFALHMYMTKDAARGLKVAMDALGEPLENLTWDPELRKRTQQLLQDQRTMAPDGDYDAQMRKIRDIRFEFTRMEVEGQYLAMNVVQTFMKSLGLGPDTLLEKLQKFNDWVTHNLPEISDKIVKLFGPVWTDMKDVFTSVWEAVKATGAAFSDFIGLLTGDKSIEGTTFSLEKFAAAVVHVVHGFAVFAEAIANVEELLAHLIGALVDVASGNFSGAADELGAAFKDVTAKAVGGVIGGVAGGVAASFVGGPLATGVGITGGAALGSNIFDKLFGGNAQSAAPATEAAHELIDHYAAQYGVDPALAHAVAMQESGENQSATSRTGARGVMQLTRGTARALGVDREDTEANVRGGVALLGQLMHQYGDTATAIAAYHDGPRRVNAALAGRVAISQEAQGEVASVLSRLGQHGSVTVGSMTINITKPHPSNDEVAGVVVNRLRDIQGKATQRNLSELQDLSYSY